MKNLLIVASLFCLTSSIHAQSVDEYISKAKSDYSSSNFEEARQNLQNALTEIDRIISKEILETLPTKLGDLTYDKTKDGTVGSGSYLGLYVTRYYGTADGEHAEVTIADNSPLYGMVSTFLNNPLLSGIAGAATGQKKITVDGYKGMMQTDENDGSHTFMVPFGDSMANMTTNIKDDAKATSMANQIPVRKVVSIVD